MGSYQVFTPGQSRPGSNDNEEVHHIPQNFTIGTSSDVI